MDIEKLKQDLESKGTPFVELEPCEVCGCTVYYFREGRKHNGCVNCHNTKKDSANGNSLPQSADMVDGNGVRIYEGRACSTCRSTIRIGENAYGVKAGTCRACAIHKQQEREQGKQLKRITTATNEHAHKFVVDSIHRSGVLEVAPTSLIEWLELKDLITQCKLRNIEEQQYNTGVRWEVCHEYPANPDDSPYRGKATVNNLVIAQFEQNRKDGNKIPDEWSLKQVVSIADATKIKNQFEAVKFWKSQKENIIAMPPEKREQYLKQQQEAESKYKELVKEITSGVCESLPVLETSRFFNFPLLLEQVEFKWSKLQNNMLNRITAAKQTGRKIDYIQARDEKLTLDAFHGATARTWIILQTLRQIYDAELILTEQGLSGEQEQQLQTIKRCAVLWAYDILDNPRQLVMGFTHPLLNVLGDSWVWGTRADEQGAQWVCVWDKVSIQSITDQMTPFDLANGNSLPQDVNPALQQQQELSPVKNCCSEDWRSTDVDYIYEQEERKRARAAAEQQQHEREQARKERDAAMKAKLGKRIASLVSGLTDGFGELYAFAAGEINELDRETAHRLIDGCYSWAGEQEARLMEISQAFYATGEDYERAVNSWQGETSHRQKRLSDPHYVFADLLKPF